VYNLFPSVEKCIIYFLLKRLRWEDVQWENLRVSMVCKYADLENMVTY
jgi:hypothetical protein